MEVGSFGRAASLYNLVSMSEVFGLTRAGAQVQIAKMLGVVEGWKDIFAGQGVE